MEAIVTIKKNIGRKQIAEFIVSEEAKVFSLEDFLFIASMLFSGKEIVGMIDDEYFVPYDNNCMFPFSWIDVVKVKRN